MIAVQASTQGWFRGGADDGIPVESWVPTGTTPEQIAWTAIRSVPSYPPLRRGQAGSLLPS